MKTFQKILILLTIAFPLAAVMATGIYLYKNLPLKTAKYYLQTGDLDAALASIDDYLTTYPTDPYAKSIKAQIQSHRQHHIQAVKLYNEVGPVEKEDYRCFLRSLFATRQWQVIPQVSEVFHRQFKGESDTWKWTAISHLHLGQFEEALNASRQLSEIQNYEHVGWALQGDCHAAKNRQQRAFDCWEKSIEIDPSAMGLHRSPEAFVKHFCEALLSANDPQRAISVLKHKSQVPLTQDLHFILGKCHLSTGDKKEAKRQWTISSRSSLHVSSLVALAKQFIQERRFADALEVIQSIQHSNVVNLELAELLVNIYQELQHKEKLHYWRNLANELKRIQIIEDQMQHYILSNPNSETAILFNCYFLSREGNWNQAAIAMGSVSSETLKTEAGIKLRSNILKRSISSETLEVIRKQFHFSTIGRKRH